MNKVEYFTETFGEKISDEEKLRRRKKYLILDIMDIINEKEKLTQEQIQKKVELALKIFFC